LNNNDLTSHIYHMLYSFLDKDMTWWWPSEVGRNM